VKLNKFMDLCLKNETLNRFTAETVLRELHDERSIVTDRGMSFKVLEAFQEPRQSTKKYEVKHSKLPSSGSLICRILTFSEW
jgi:hypothetical protein